MTQAETLIDKAKRLGYTQQALADCIEVKQQDIAKLKAGTRTLTPELAARLADVVGVDPLEAARDAMIAADLAKPHGGKLAEILGKVAAVGVAVLLGFYYSAPSAYATENVAEQLTRLHIVFSRLRALVMGHVGMLTASMGACTPIPPAPHAGPRLISKKAQVFHRLADLRADPIDQRGKAQRPPDHVIPSRLNRLSKYTRRSGGNCISRFINSVLGFGSGRLLVANT